MSRSGVKLKTGKIAPWIGWNHCSVKRPTLKYKPLGRMFKPVYYRLLCKLHSFLGMPF
jgi:hypothetical protein